MRRAGIRLFLPGLLLGLTVGGLGFTDFGDLHRMLVFRDLRLLLAFATAVTLSIALFAVLRRWLSLPPVSFHRGTLPGAALFGVGWAVTGVCPGVAVIQIGQGLWLGFATLAGIFVGIALHARFGPRGRIPVTGC